MEKRPALNPTLVHEIVLKAHGDLARVQELVAQEPALVNAAWDWGGGDWETPLDAAAHVGRRDIAEYLLANGARFDLFAAAMLGELAVIKAVLAIHPAMKEAFPCWSTPNRGERKPHLWSSIYVRWIDKPFLTALLHFSEVITLLNFNPLQSTV